MPFVSQERYRDSKGGIEQSERQARHQSDLFVTKPHFLLDWLRYDGDNLPIEKVEHDDDKQHSQHVVGFTIRRGCS